MENKMIKIRVAILAVACLYCLAQAYSISGRVNKPEPVSGSSLVALASNYAAEAAYQEQQDKARLFGVVGLIALAMALPDIQALRQDDEEEDNGEEL